MITSGSILSRLLVLGAMLLPLGCSDGDDRPPPGEFDYDNVSPDTDMDATAGEEPREEEEPVCLDGETQKCSVYLPTQNGVVNCFRGVQVCENGQWGDCADPPEQKKSDNPAEGDETG